MKNIPTAEQVMLKNCNTKTNDYGTFFNSIGEEQCKKAMIEFAKIHVEAALKKASEEADYITDGQEHITDVWIDKDSILNAYPLTNIK